MIDIIFWSFIKYLIFWFCWDFSLVLIYHIFPFIVLICTTGKDIGRLYKYNRSKISTTTLKKPVLLSSAAHTSSASNLTQTSISSQLDNKDITKNQKNHNTSNIDDIHSFVTPRGENSFKATSTSTRLTALSATIPIAPV